MKKLIDILDDIFKNMPDMDNLESVVAKENYSNRKYHIGTCNMILLKTELDRVKKEMEIR